MPLLKEIETLSRLRREGVLSDAEFAAAKAAILKEVPEAEQADRVRMGDGTALALRCLLPSVTIGALVFAFGIPTMLSLTLGVTVLAALVIGAWRNGDV